MSQLWNQTMRPRLRRMEHPPRLQQEFQPLLQLATLQPRQLVLLRVLSLQNQLTRPLVHPLQRLLAHPQPIQLELPPLLHLGLPLEPQMPRQLASLVPLWQH